MTTTKVLLLTGFFVILSCLPEAETSNGLCWLCPSCAKCRMCPRSPCDEMDLPTIIKHLWKFPSDISQVAEEYKTELIRLAKASRKSPEDKRKREQGLLISLTLWAVDRYTGLVSPIPPSCVYQKMVDSAICGCPNKVKKAYEGYLHLCSNATEYSIRIGMLAAGCPVPDLPDVTVAPECKFGESLKTLLNRNNSDLPNSLKILIEKLSQSDDPDDIAIAFSAAGSVTKASVDTFTKLLEGDELLKVLRLKACPIRIAPWCCDKRLKDLTARTEKLKKAVGKILNPE